MSWQIDVYDDDDSGSDYEERSFEDSEKLPPNPPRMQKKATRAGKGKAV